MIDLLSLEKMKIPTVKGQIKIYNTGDPIELLQLPRTIEELLKNKNIATVDKFYKIKRKRLKRIKGIEKNQLLI